MSNQILPLAICIFQNGDQIFVGEGYDPVKQETFYRPLGGGIEFGELAEETIHRELREEVGAEAVSVQYLFTLENISHSTVSLGMRSSWFLMGGWQRLRYMNARSSKGRSLTLSAKPH
jgi:ADP-ribose pyrophosphatase YjhB (NUDIX family)